jgi:hypothetical protein
LALGGLVFGLFAARQSLHTPLKTLTPPPPPPTHTHAAGTMRPAMHSGPAARRWVSTRPWLRSLLLRQERLRPPLLLPTRALVLVRVPVLVLVGGGRCTCPCLRAIQPLWVRYRPLPCSSCGARCLPDTSTVMRQWCLGLPLTGTTSNACTCCCRPPFCLVSFSPSARPSCLVPGRPISLQPIYP